MQGIQTESALPPEPPFKIGSILSCRTCHGELLDGEVVAFDMNTKMMALKTPLVNVDPSSSIPEFTHAINSQSAHQIRVVNMNAVEHESISIKTNDAVTPLAPQLERICLEKIKRRSRDEANKKKRCISTEQVPRHAQGLFMHITKTIEDTCWDGQTILVWKRVKISPPYDNAEECVTSIESGGGATDGKAERKTKQNLQHVRRIVDQYYRRQQRSTSPNSDLQITSPTQQQNSRTNSEVIAGT